MPYGHARRKRVKQICKLLFSLTHSCAQMQCCDCLVSGPSGVYCYWVALSLTRSQPHRKFMGYYGKPSRPTVMRERLMCSIAITWKCTRASAEILSYASSWCSQCDVECRTALAAGLWQNPLPAKTPLRQKSQSGQPKPSLTKTPLQVNVLGYMLL